MKSLFTLPKQELSTSIQISASPEEVWNQLVEFESYPEWNSFIKTINGIPEIGEKIEVTIQAPGKSPMNFTPKVLVFEKNKLFVWKGKVLIPGLFDGEHRFEIKDNGDGTTTFIQSEKFSGILIPFFKEMIHVNSKQGFENMNAELRTRVEALNILTSK
jgi:hypothetical protein